MKKSIALLLMMMFYCAVNAQQFIKTFGDADYGKNPRIIATNDNGWVVFTLDSLRLTKFNNCGIPQWSRKYDTHNSLIGLDNFIMTNDNGFVMLTQLKYNSNMAVGLVTKLNAQGDILWSKSFEDGIYRQWPYSISEDQQGNLITYSNVENIQNNIIFNMLSKLNSNGDLIYINFYDHGWIWGGAIVTSDNGLLIRTGNTLIKTTNSGNIQWTTSFTGTKYYLAPIEVSDGYILTGHTSPNNEISFYKYNLQGIQQWGGYRKSNYFGTPPTFHKKNNGNICAVFNDATIEFDKDLNIIKQASIQGNMGMIGKKLCYLTDGTPILTGIRPGSSDLFIAKLDDAYHTNCDAAGLPIVLETDTSFLIPTPVSKSTHNLNTINHVFVYDTFTIVTKLACPRNFYLGNDTLVCASAAVILQNQFIEPFENFLWSTGATTSSITVTQTGKYWLLVTYNCGEETLIDTITVTFNPPIITNLGTDVVVCEKETYTFKAPSCDSCSYWWSDNSVGDTMMVSTIGDYWLMVTDSIGCVYSDTVAFNISKCECFLWVPNSFTPNNDGLNDVFQPSYYCDLASFDLKILNRWGQPIFSSENAMESWNGKDRNASVQSGVYFYTVTYTPIIKGQIDKPITQTGVITVIY